MISDIGISRLITRRKFFSLSGCPWGQDVLHNSWRLKKKQSDPMALIFIHILDLSWRGINPETLGKAPESHLFSLFHYMQRSWSRRLCAGVSLVTQCPQIFTRLPPYQGLIDPCKFQPSRLGLLLSIRVMKCVKMNSWDYFIHRIDLMKRERATAGLVDFNNAKLRFRGKKYFEQVLQI